MQIHKQHWSHSRKDFSLTTSTKPPQASLHSRWVHPHILGVWEAFLVLPQIQVSGCSSIWEVDLGLSSCHEATPAKKCKCSKRVCTWQKELLHWVCPDWRQASPRSVFGLPDSGSSRLSFWLQQIVSFWEKSSDLIWDRGDGAYLCHVLAQRETEPPSLKEIISGRENVNLLPLLLL